MVTSAEGEGKVKEAPVAAASSFTGCLTRLIDCYILAPHPPPHAH